MLLGDSGVGKTALAKHLLRLLAEENGTSFRGNTILGSVLNYSEKSTGFMQSISAITSYGGQQIEGRKNSIQIALLHLYRSLLLYITL